MQVYYNNEGGGDHTKRLSEVCKIVGVTRRTLQEYDKIGLVSPTSKTDSGYWLYDEDTIVTLMIIQIFVEAGYERKEIKDIICSSSFDLISELDNAIERLKDRKKRIEGMINSINVMKMFSDLPIELINNMDYFGIYSKKSFKDYLDESIDSSEVTPEDVQKSMEYFPLYFDLLSIGLLREKGIDDPKVQICSRDYCRFMMDNFFNGDEELKDAPESWKLESISELTEDLSKEEEFRTLINAQCGEGTMEFIISAVKSFCKNEIKRAK